MHVHSCGKSTVVFTNDRPVLMCIPNQIRLLKGCLAVTRFCRTIIQYRLHGKIYYAKLLQFLIYKK